MSTGGYCCYCQGTGMKPKNVHPDCPCYYCAGTGWSSVVPFIPRDSQAGKLAMRKIKRRKARS